MVVRYTSPKGKKRQSLQTGGGWYIYSLEALLCYLLFQVCNHLRKKVVVSVRVMTCWGNQWQSLATGTL